MSDGIPNSRPTARAVEKTEPDYLSLIIQLRLQVEHLQNDLDKLRDQTENRTVLQNTLDSLKNRTDDRLGADPTFRVFFAKKADGSDTQFQEQVLNAGVFVDGDPDKSRRCTDDSDPSAIITPDPSDHIVALLETEDFDGDGNKVKRYLELATAVSKSIFKALIGASTQDGTNKRWTYAFTEVTQTGTLTYATKSGGRTGSAGNGIEYPNGVSGLWGNGVNGTTLAAGFDIQPITPGVVVNMTETNVSGTKYYSFSSANGIDGTCGTDPTQFAISAG